MANYKDVEKIATKIDGAISGLCMYSVLDNLPLRLLLLTFLIYITGLCSLLYC